MKVSVTIEFPCSQEDWIRLEQIKALAGIENVSVPASEPSPERGAKFDDFDPLGQALVDHCVKHSVGKCKPTQTQLLREWIGDNPGCLPQEAIEGVSQYGFDTSKLKYSLNSLLYGGRHTISKIGGRLYLT